METSTLWYNTTRKRDVLEKGAFYMTTSMLNMYISFAGMIFMILAIGLIFLSRYKLKGFFRVIVAIIAYILMLLAGLIIFYIVLSGPTGS